jgi:hypothetical protein
MKYKLIFILLIFVSVLAAGIFLPQNLKGITSDYDFSNYFSKVYIFANRTSFKDLLLNKSEYIKCGKTFYSGLDYSKYLSSNLSSFADNSSTLMTNQLHFLKYKKIISGENNAVYSVTIILKDKNGNRYSLKIHRLIRIGDKIKILKFSYH